MFVPLALYIASMRRSTRRTDPALRMRQQPTPVQPTMNRPRKIKFHRPTKIEFQLAEERDVLSLRTELGICARIFGRMCKKHCGLKLGALADQNLRLRRTAKRIG